MPRLNLRRWVYIVFCVLAWILPLALFLLQIALDALPSASSSDDSLFAAIGNFALSALTYPAGLVGTIACSVMIYSGLFTPTEAVFCAAPFYIGAGYFQWYVLIPKHFRARSAAEADVIGRARGVVHGQTGSDVDNRGK